MYISTLTISSKGQVVLPKKIRNALGSNVISLIINDQNQVLLTPVNKLAGSLSNHSKDTSLTFEEIREKSWEKSTSARKDKPSSEE